MSDSVREHKNAPPIIEIANAFACAMTRLTDRINAFKQHGDAYLQSEEGQQMIAKVIDTIMRYQKVQEDIESFIEQSRRV